MNKVNSWYNCFIISILYFNNINSHIPSNGEYEQIFFFLDLWCECLDHGNTYRKPQAIKTWSYISQSWWMATSRKQLPHQKGKGTLWNRRQKCFKTQRIRESAVRFCLLIISEAIKSYRYDCLNLRWTKTTSGDILN